MSGEEECEEEKVECKGENAKEGRGRICRRKHAAMVTGSSEPLENFKKIILRGQFTIKNTGISGSEIFKIPLKLKSTLKGL
jgi:hypothetical protein